MSRKFRWIFEANFPSGKLEPQFIRLEARPQLEIKEQLTEEGIFKPVEQKWKSIKITYFDSDANKTKGLFEIIFQFYTLYHNDNPMQSIEHLMGEGVLKLLCPKYIYPEYPKDKEATLNDGTLGSLGLGRMTAHGIQDGWEELETWTLRKMWPKEINFGELDYSSSADTSIEVTWNFAECIYKNSMANIAS